MGNMHGESRTCHRAPHIRPKSKPTFDDSTGNALKDGYTRLGPRRPLGAMAGEIMDADEAKRFEEFHERYADDGVMAGFGYVDW